MQERPPIPEKELGVQTPKIEGEKEAKETMRIRGMIKKRELFRGREDELREIWNYIKYDASVSVIGPRESGKSSLLYHVYQTGPEKFPDRTFVYVDCEHLRAPRHFFREVLRSMGEKGETADDFREALRHRKTVLCIDEIEHAGKGYEREFFAFMRGMASNYDIVLITASERGLYEITPSGEEAVGSPFHNIFNPLIIKPLK